MPSPLELEGRGGRGGLLNAAMPGACAPRIVAARMNWKQARCDGPAGMVAPSSGRFQAGNRLLPGWTATGSGAAASRRHALRSRQWHLQALPHPNGDLHRFLESLGDADRGDPRVARQRAARPCDLIQDAGYSAASAAGLPGCENTAAHGASAGGQRRRNAVLHLDAVVMKNGIFNAALRAGGAPLLSAFHQSFGNRRTWCALPANGPLLRSAQPCLMPR